MINCCMERSKILNTIGALKGFVNTTPENHGVGTTTAVDGVPYNLFDITDKDISLQNIAHSLSKQCRYNGHVGSKHIYYANQGYYSVAQHSVRMSEAALLAYGDVLLAMGCLVHDAAEFFTGDMIRPLKRALKLEGDTINTIEGGADGAVLEYFGIPEDIIPIIKKIDYNIAQDEMTFLLKHQEVDFDYWLPNKAYDMFMAQFKKLKILMDYNRKDMVKTDANGKY